MVQMLLDQALTDVELLTVNEVAAKLKISPFTIYRWIRDRRIPATKPGGDKMGWRIRADDLERFITRGNTM